MHKIYSIVKCFVFIAFSLSAVKADRLLNEKNIQTIKDLSKKKSFREDDIKNCFSLFGLQDEEDRYSQTAKEIKQILERGKTDALEYEILANLQKVLARFLVYNIQHLSVQSATLNFDESYFYNFSDVLDAEGKTLIKSTFYKKKEDLFKDFIKKHKAEIVSLSKNEEFNENLAKHCFRLFVNEDVDDFANDQVYKNCINVLISLIAVENLSNQLGVLLPLQQILKNLLVFYMQQFDELSIKNFYCKFKDPLQGILRIFPEGYKSKLKECFYELLNDSHRVELSPKEEIDSFDKLDKDIYANKKACAFALQHFFGGEKKLKLLQSASTYLDRFPSLNDGSLNKFIFFSAEKREGKVVIPEIYCFLSLESCFLSLESMENKNVDLTAFSVCLYNKKSIFWDNGKEEEISLYPQIEDNKFYFLKEIKVSMLQQLNASCVLNSKVLKPSFNALISEDLCQATGQKFLENGKKDEKSIALYLSPRSLKNIFYGLLWKSCLKEKNAEVQHVLTNYSLGRSGIGDKFLCIKDSISPENQKQQLEIKVYVFATDELLFKALQNFVSRQECRFPEPMFLDYNEKKECFELLDVSHFQRKKKAIYGKLDEKYMFLKQRSKNIVNQQRIEASMDVLLKQRESDVAELDMDMVRGVELLLEEENERLEAEQKRQAELSRQQKEAERKAKEEAEQKRKAEEERKRREEEQRKLAEQQRLERERLEREEAERRRLAAEEQRRREEEARKPKGFTGQQLVNYVVQHGTPKKSMLANRAVRAQRIQPGTTYLSLSQLDPFFHEAFKSLEKENK
ncbi:MAG: hypothetical protein ACLRFH_04100 [Opitutales bacterium]